MNRRNFIVGAAAAAGAVAAGVTGHAAAERERHPLMVVHAPRYPGTEEERAELLRFIRAHQRNDTACLMPPGSTISLIEVRG